MKWASYHPHSAGEINEAQNMFGVNSPKVTEFDRTLRSTDLYSTAALPTEETLARSAPVDDPPQPDPADRKQGTHLITACIYVYLELSM